MATERPNASQSFDDPPPHHISRGSGDGEGGDPTMSKRLESFAVVSLLVSLAGCGSNDPTSPPSPAGPWLLTNAADAFSFNRPPDLVEVHQSGIDSFSRKYQRASMIMEFVLLVFESSAGPPGRLCRGNGDRRVAMSSCVVDPRHVLRRAALQHWHLLS